jgi:preprotein translocase subunit SecF
MSKKAFTGLAVFLIAIVLYLSITFEWRMAIAALVALFHDVFITVGIYSLIGFEVTPATVIGVLTILGYSLYDTVVVFDKVKENTRGLAGGSRMTYSDAANLAVNQTLVRSINTSIVGLLPVAGLLFVGAYVLGAGTLKDLALALFVGIAVGTYSSIFVATPVLAELKEREPSMRALRNRVEARRASRGEVAPVGTMSAAAAGAPVPKSKPSAGTKGAEAAAAASAAATKTAAKPPAARGPRNQPKRSKKRKRR